jgi:heme-degrading monooxygenase HmoA
LPIEVYDQITERATAPLKASPGFRSHVAYPVEGGFRVTEIWDSAADHAAFFDSAVKPNVPEGVPLEVEVIELHNTIGL